MLVQKSEQCLQSNPDVYKKRQNFRESVVSNAAMWPPIQESQQTKSDITYEQALERASNGFTDFEIINAIKAELKRSEGSSTEHAVDVKINLGAALLNMGNNAGDLSTYEQLYLESESVLHSVLASHPGHKGAEQNLAAVLRNMRMRKALDGTLDNVDISSAANEELQRSCSSIDDNGTEFVSSYLDKTVFEHLLSYTEALQKAMAGLTDSRVIESIKHEHIQAIESGITENILNVKVNLAVALMQRGLHFVSHPAAHPVIMQSCFYYSENILLSALKLDPDHEGAKRNLFSLRQNIQQLMPLDNLTIYANSSKLLEADESYQIALQKAMMGTIDSSVLQSMRQTHSTLEKQVRDAFRHKIESEIHAIVNVKINLGVALLEREIQMIDQPVSIKVCDQLQQEAEGLFLSALSLDPNNDFAAKNLNILRIHGRLRSEISLLGGNGGLGNEGSSDLRFWPVYATLTTIPPRMTKDLRLAIDSLLPQVDHVYLSVSDSYARFGGTYELPPFLKEEPYASRVTVSFGPDYGAATKYLGSLNVMPKKGWVFVGDDDQVYKEDIIQRMINSVTRLGAYQNSDRNIRFKSISMSDLITGFWGVMYPLELLQKLAKFPVPPGARFVDDQWMSIYCLFHGIPVYLTELDQEKDIFKIQKNTGSHGLLESGNNYKGRADHIRSMESFFGVYLGSIYPTYHHVDVHFNLGAALLRLAMDNVDNVICLSKALESEKMLQAAFNLHPGNQRIGNYLQTARKFKDQCPLSVSKAGIDQYSAADKFPRDIFESDSSVAYFPNTWQLSLDELKASYGRSLMFRNTLKSELMKVSSSHSLLSMPALSYSDALRSLWTNSVDGLPARGAVTEIILQTLKWEQLDVEHLVRLSRYTLLMMNLGVSLYGLGSTAETAMPSLSSELYSASEEMFETVLQMQPHNALAAENVAKSHAKQANVAN